MSIPRFLFSTDSLAPKLRQEGYRENVSFLFNELRFDDSPPPDKFHAQSEGFNFQEFLLVRSDASRTEHIRSRNAAEADGGDCFFVELNLGCEINILCASSEELSRKGEVLIIDFAQQSHWIPRSSSSVLVMVVPRHRMMEIHPDPASLHGRVLKLGEGSTRLLGNYMKSLSKEAPSLDNAEHLIQSSLGILAAAIGTKGMDTDLATLGADLAFKAQVEIHVRKHLKNPNLSPVTIAQEMGVSRSHFYRQIESDCIASRIQELRMNRILRELRSPLNRDRKIIEIAEKWGYSSYQTFMRAFKRTFGMTPGEARNLDASTLHSQSSLIDTNSIEPIGEQWLRRLIDYA